MYQLYHAYEQHKYTEDELERRAARQRLIRELRAARPKSKPFLHIIGRGLVAIGTRLAERYEAGEPIQIAHQRPRYGI